MDPLASLKERVDSLESAMQLHRHYGSDGTQQLAMGSPTYGGQVNSDGTVGTFFPTGWTSTKNSTGKYTVTHTLGTANFALVANAYNVVTIAEIFSWSSTTFVLQFWSTASSLTDSAFHFVIKT